MDARTVRQQAGAVAEYRRVIEQAWPKEQKAKFAEARAAVLHRGSRRLPRPAARSASATPRRSPSCAPAPSGLTRPSPDHADRHPAVRHGDRSRPSSISTRRSVRRRRHAAATGVDLDFAGCRLAGLRPASAAESPPRCRWFGNVTFWTFWNNGYEAMRALDDNGDGELRGSELRHLAIWRDANRNGVSEPGEVRPLARAWDRGAVLPRRNGDGIYTAAWSERGVRFDDGGPVRPTTSSCGGR